MFNLPNFLRDVAGKAETEDSKKRILLFCLPALLIIFIFYLVIFLKPSVTVLFDLISKVRQRSGDIQAVQNDLPFKDKLLNKRKAQQESLAQYERMLSKEKEIPALLENLSKMARDAGVKILGITPLGVTKLALEKDNVQREVIYQELPILISAQSGYHQLGTFINKLETSRRYMQVSDLKIQTNQTNPKRHRVEFVVYAYTFKSKE